MFFVLIQIVLSQPFAADFIFRMHNRDGWVGPKTIFDGYSGHLLQINCENDIEQLLAEKRPYPEVLVIPLALLTDAIISKIESLYSPKPYLQGFIVLKNDTHVYSPGVPFPNKKYSSYDTNSTFVWNPSATSMIEHRYNFPIVYLPESEIDNLINHMKYFGTKAGVYLRIFMLSRGNSKKCLKDDECKIIGGLSLYGSFTKDYNASSSSASSSSSVWAIANYDTFGFFPYAAVGADYSLSGFVSLLAAIESFKGVDWTKAKKQLRFAFFDGEELGYLGSSKFLKDVKDFQCQKWNDEHTACNFPYRLDFGFEKVSPSDFDTVIEIKSVANADHLYVHTNKNGRAFGKSLVNSASPLPVEMADDSLPGIPPSSTNTFIKMFPSINHAVLTGYKGIFPANNSYGSTSDSKYSVESITKASQTLANTLASLCGIKFKPIVNETIISEIMKAFVKAPADSEYLTKLFPNSKLPTDHVSTYAGVYKYYTLQLKQLIIREILKDTIATNITDINCSSDDQCKQLGMSCSQYYGKCINYTMNLHPAYSEAFEYDDDKEEIIIVNESDAHPFECEADWDSPNLQYITLPSLWIGRISVGVGILLWALLSFLLSALWNINQGHLQK